MFWEFFLIFIRCISAGCQLHICRSFNFRYQGCSFLLPLFSFFLKLFSCFSSLFSKSLFFSFFGFSCRFGLLQCLKLSLSGFHLFSFFLDFFTDIFHLLIRKERILDNKLLPNTFQVFIVTRCHSSNRIDLSELKKSNTHCSPNIFEDINSIVRCP